MMRRHEPLYDARVALDFFRSGGTPEKVREGSTIFAEGRKGGLLGDSRMYLLLQGEVDLVARKKVLRSVKPGEIFGELAALSHAPRSASAVAKSACKLIALDEDRFFAALRRKPAFALMLMSVMIARLRETIALLRESNSLSADDAWKESAAFNRKVLADLMRGLVEDPPVFYLQGQEIMHEGQAGLRMYAVLEGRVAVSIGGRVVERLGPGGVFGEAALLENTPRLADAVAETDCSLLPVGREAFLALVKLSPKFADTILSSLAERLRFLTARLQ